jgi:peptidoglycan/LPS O-acetylase OafA/YrhL
MANERVRFSETNASVILDLVRGLAAMLVAVGHWRNIFFIDYPGVQQTSRFAHLLAVPYLITSGGHQAVVLFFILSGYLISGSVFRLLRARNWRWGTYLTHRLVRLWMVLLPGLVLCFFWDEIGLRSGRAPNLYHGMAANHMIGNVAGLLSIKIFLGNLFFLGPAFVPTFGSDSALWSLPFEFWYYMLFPLGLLAMRREFSWWTRIFCAVGFLLVAWFVRGDILGMFPVWLLGTLLAVVKPPRVGVSTRLVAAALYPPVLWCFAKQQWITNGVYADYAFGLVTALFLWLMLSAQAKANGHGLLERGARQLSRFSFTLYVVHVPILVFAASRMVGDDRWQPTLGHLGEALGWLLLILLYAYGVAALTEFRTDRVRRLIERLLGNPDAAVRNPHEAVLEGEPR